MWPLAIVVGIAAVVAGGIGTILWIQDRPLRQAEELLESGLQARTQALIDGTTASDDEIKRSYHIVTEYLERFPNSSQGLALQARILVHMERPEEAPRLFSEAQAATPAELQDQARAHMMLGNFDSALPIIQQVLAMEPQNEDAIYELTLPHPTRPLPGSLEREQFTQLPDNAREAICCRRRCTANSATRSPRWRS
ncbi:MAG: hypothetical protein R3B96_17650 [Pirellulaceae bacterium]